MPLPSNSADRFVSQYADPATAGLPDWPAIRASAVNPNDSADLPFVSRALWVGGAGSISVDMAESGSAVVIAGIPAGTLIPIRVRRVRTTGTTATAIVALD